MAGENEGNEQVKNTQAGNAPANNPADDEFDPLRSGVVERDHVKQNMGMGNTGRVAETIPEDTVRPNMLGSQQTKDDGKKTTGSTENGAQGGGSKKVEKPPIEKPFENTASAEMNKAAKKREAEKAANTLLFHYCLYVPMPFKSWASFNERKIEQLALEDKIDLNMTFELDRDFTVKEYIDGLNKEVDRAFTVSEDRKNEMREALVDLLLEQGMVLTPSQRLLLAVGGHIVEMGITAFKISQSNNRVLEFFMNAHAQKKEETAQRHSGGGGGGHHSEPVHHSPPPSPSHGGGSADEHLSHQEEEHHAHSEDEPTVTATDETTGEPVAVQDVTPKKPDGRKKNSRPKGSGKGAKKKNVLSMDEAITDETKEGVKEEVMGGGETNGQGE